MIRHSIEVDEGCSRQRHWKSGVASLPILAAVLQLVACSAATPVGSAAGEDSPADVDVRLIAFNDFHGYLDPPGDTVKVAQADGGGVAVPVGGAAFLAAAINRSKLGHPRSVVVAAGDLVGASPLDSGMFHDEPAVEVLGRMGLEISSVGNHEFDHGRAELLRKQYGGCAPDGTPGKDTCVGGEFKGAAYHYLAANVIDKSSGKTLFPGYEIKTFDAGGGHRIAVAFVGLVLKNTPAMVNPEGVAGLRFTGEAEAANGLLPEIRVQGANAAVILIHQGGATDGSYNDKACPGLKGDILPIVDRLDPMFGVVVSAHTHQAYNCRYAGRVLTSAGSYGRFLTTIDLRLSAQDGRLLGAQADNLAVTEAQAEPSPAGPPAFTADPAVAALVAGYDAMAAPVTGRVVGGLASEISREPLQDPVSGKAQGESALGELVADSELAATRKLGAVAAFINSGGVRADLAASPVTYGDAYKVLPFGNHLVTLSLSGEQLYTLLGEQWGKNGQPRLLQVSAGLHYDWDDRRSLADGKVVPGSLRIGGRPVRPKRRYRITVVDFLATGGDGFVVLRDATDRVSSASDIEAFTSYLQLHSPASPPAPDRVSRIDP